MQFNQLNEVTIATEVVVCRVSQNTDFTEAGNGRNAQPTDCMQCCQSWGWVVLYSVVSYMRWACVTEKGGKMHVPKKFLPSQTPSPILVVRRTVVYHYQICFIKFLACISFLEGSLKYAVSLEQSTCVTCKNKIKKTNKQ